MVICLNVILLCLKYFIRPLFLAILQIGENQNFFLSGEDVLCLMGSPFTHLWTQLVSLSPYDLKSLG